MAELRRSLGAVAEDVRRPLVEVLDGLEGCAGGVGGVMDSWFGLLPGP